MLRWVATAVLVVGLITVAAASALHVFTTSKLERMAMIRGEIPGATTVERPIVELARAPGADVCWVYFEETSPPLSDGRVNLPCDDWALLTEGRPIEVVYLPDDDGAYLRDGIYASPGNQAFDETLLWVWQFGIGAGVLLVLLSVGALVVVRLRR